MVLFTHSFNLNIVIVTMFGVNIVEKNNIGVNICKVVKHSFIPGIPN